MGFLDSLFGGGQKAAAEAQAEAAERAMQERRAAEKRARQDFSPYLQAGQRALPQYEGMIQEMMDQPGFLDSLISKYQPSLGYQNRYNEGQRAVTQAMGSSGMYGSGDFFKSLQEEGQNVANNDLQQYLMNILGVRGNAMNALGGVTNQGFNAASNIGTITANTGAGLAEDQTRYGEAQANRSMASSNILNRLLSLGSNIVSGGLSDGGGGFGQGFSRGMGIYGHGLS